MGGHVQADRRCFLVPPGRATARGEHWNASAGGHHGPNHSDVGIVRSRPLDQLCGCFLDSRQTGRGIDVQLAITEVRCARLGYFGRRGGWYCGNHHVRIPNGRANRRGATDAGAAHPVAPSVRGGNVGTRADIRSYIDAGFSETMGERVCKLAVTDERNAAHLPSWDWRCVAAGARRVGRGGSPLRGAASGVRPYAPFSTHTPLVSRI